MWVIGATAFVNLCNLAYHIFMVRFLSPADYGALNALAALLLVITVPAGTVQTTVSQLVSQRLAQTDFQGVRRLVRRGVVQTGLLGLLLFAAIAALASVVAGFLQLHSKVLVIAWGAAIAFMIMTPVILGALQGLQKFAQLGLNLSLGAFFKLTWGGCLVAFGFGVMGALHGFWIAGALTLLCALLQIRHCLKVLVPRPPRQGLEGVFVALSSWADEVVAVVRNPWAVSRYALWAALGVLAYTCLTSLDVVLAKHYFPPHESGLYAIASMVAKMVLFLPAALSIILFPKVAYLTARAEETRPVLLKVLLLTGLLSGGCALLFIMEPERVLHLFTGTIRADCIPLVRVLAMAMAAMSMANVGLVYLLGVKKVRNILPFAAAALAQIQLIILFHGTLIQVAGATLTVSFLLAGYSLWVAFYG